MSNEVTIPLLPCASIDDIIAFYEVLGFRTTYQQRKPNPSAALQREDLNLHFFEMPEFRPEQSYGSCLVLTTDIKGLHEAFAAGMRSAYGKVLVAGIPRMTRPRARKNYDGLGGFTVVDPGGNWIRVVQNPAAGPTAEPDGEPVAQPSAEPVAQPPAEPVAQPPAEPVAQPPAEPVARPHDGPAAEPAGEPVDGRLAKAMGNAVVQADSRGDLSQAVRILDSALRRPDAADDPVELVEALVYRAELALGLHDPVTAAAMLDRAGQVALTEDQRRRAAAALDNAADLAAAQESESSQDR
ncbi:VOC family protein [Actinoplanes sp. DH11]|uniref:VOC family protein n=1 Tax=Actinoplanes sp. DH11 TaxID=2857011 RepID=UPI001E5DEE79|nr:VOC family protein [Actinoplanes sp. DH11]